MVAKEIRLSANAMGKIAPGAHSTGEGIPGSSRSDPGMRRRQFLVSTAMTLVFSATSAQALVLKDGLPWAPSAGTPPTTIHPGPWVYFTPEEGAAVEALVDRLIPPDPRTPGGKDAGCAVFIDRQLAGSYGSAEGLYMHGPFADGTPEQGNQSPLTPAARYRQALSALDKYCRAAYAGKPFAQISDDEKDKVLSGLEKDEVQLEGTSGRAFFEYLLQNTREGFFADPVYGGNRDMVGWKMVGFPGARYDYRDWVERHNERYPLPPVGIAGRRE
ncbi:gluconate 2-dehydrogenase subunit 3 family protein [Bradyrhizobium sp. CB1650]|uniref:gluconate 2-dehydrogenase subunit 3 family protein n=1 Tax=Bradyrhizobium sp. CB1650 TaxID=3039153 RepID=UPI0024353C83|nr:gluconate 2-dehydrogenase subunit 3 family protein [Bradyrhizobium sp. CB1650]WGD55187.1 gluconate 2-dehydrogenase subunit 3 family protein [Bradyrhizobium sp. CB1650]